jgi:hypothetical protein
MTRPSPVGVVSVVVTPSLSQEAAVVGLYPFLGQPALVVVPEGTDHIPLEVLPGGLDSTDGRVGKEPGEVTGERGVRRQALHYSMSSLPR